MTKRKKYAKSISYIPIQKSDVGYINVRTLDNRLYIFYNVLSTKEEYRNGNRCQKSF